jgi:hypothetical protein
MTNKQSVCVYARGAAIVVLGMAGLFAAQDGVAAMLSDGSLAATGSSQLAALGATASPAAVPLNAPGTTLVTQTLYRGTTLFSGMTFTQIELDVPAAGSLSVTLRDMEFPALLGALSFSLVRGGEVLAVQNGGGGFDLDMAGPATLFGFVYAVGAPGVNVGSYYLDIQHKYEEAVPLPASLWLLLSGASWIGWLGRRRRLLTTSPARG